MDFQEAKRTLHIPKTICDDFEERSVDFDILLPDYCPDVAVILKSHFTTCVTSRFQSSDRYTVDGKATIRVLYVSEDRRQVYCYEATQPFSVSFKSENACHHYIHIKHDYLNCRAISPRRMDVHGAYRIYLQSFGEGDITVLDTPNKNGIYCLNESILSTIPVSETDKSFVVDETIDLGVKVDRLLYTDCIAFVNEQKILTNKLIIKGTLHVKTVYYSNDQLVSTNETIPFSQIVDVDGLTEHMHCDTSVTIAENEAHLYQQENGSSLLSLNCKLIVCLRCSLTHSDTIVKDMYSIHHPLICETTPIHTVLKKACQNQRMMLQQTLTLPDTVTSVEELWGEMKHCTIEKRDTESILSCCVLVSMLARDKDGMIGYYERTVDIETNWNGEGDSCTATLIGVLGTVNGNSLRVQMDTVLHTNHDCEQLIHAVCDVTQDSKTSYSHAETGVRIVYGKQGENLWDIAKSQHANIHDMMTENDLDVECLPADMMLMIPMC